MTRSPNDFCPGCGYYWYTHDHTHRADCTAKPKQDNNTQRGHK